MRGSSAAFEVVNVKTGEPIAAVYEGGRFYTVVADGNFITVGADGSFDVPGGLTLEPLDSATATGGASPAAARSPGVRGVAGGLGLFVVINEILAPIARNLNLQRQNIAVGQAQVNFWLQFGALVGFRVWNIGDNAPAPEGTEADTAWYGSGSYPYTTKIDTRRFAATLPSVITSYRDFLLFLDAAKTLGTINEEPEMPLFPTAQERQKPRRYFTIMNAPDHDKRTRIELTNILSTLGERLLRQLDAGMRQRVGALSEAQRKQIFRLRRGSETDLYRSARGRQKILSAQQLLGDDPWVRTLGEESEGGVWQSTAHNQYRDRVLVTPANTDAQRSAVVSAYQIYETPDEVLEEVKSGHRPIISRSPADGEVVSFVAGPEPGNSRFGETRYYRHPNWPDVRRTVAIGELQQFWVDAQDLEPVELQESEDYAKGRRPATAK